MNHVQRIENLEHNAEACRKQTEEYYEAIETHFDVKDVNVDVDVRMIHEGKLLSLDMEHKEFIGEKTHGIEEKYLKYADEVIHCGDE